MVCFFCSQVKNLKQKSEAQDTEIQKLKQSAKDATMLAADRSSKCIRAIQTVKIVTDQVINSNFLFSNNFTFSINQGTMDSWYLSQEKFITKRGYDHFVYINTHDFIKTDA